MIMYMILYQIADSFCGRENKQFSPAFCEDISELSRLVEELKSRESRCRVFKLDGLEELESIEVTYEEILKEES